MKFRNFSFCFFIFATGVWNSHFCDGTRYLFLCEDEKIFTNCENKPNALGIESFFDMSNLNVEIGEQTVSVEGSFEVVWDVEPTDRIDLKGELWKESRGGWQQTVFTTVQKDLCGSIFDPEGLWFKNWGQFVEEDDRKCINHKGNVYHHLPFDADLIFDVQGEKFSGRHKLVLELEAFNGQEKRSEVCVEVLMDVLTL